MVARDTPWRPYVTKGRVERAVTGAGGRVFMERLRRFTGKDDGAHWKTTVTAAFELWLVGYQESGLPPDHCTVMGVYKKLDDRALRYIWKTAWEHVREAHPDTVVPRKAYDMRHAKEIAEFLKSEGAHWFLRTDQRTPKLALMLAALVVDGLDAARRIAADLPDLWKVECNGPGRAEPPVLEAPRPQALRYAPAEPVWAQQPQQQLQQPPQPIPVSYGWQQQHQGQLPQRVQMPPQLQWQQDAAAQHVAPQQWQPAQREYPTRQVERRVPVKPKEVPPIVTWEEPTKPLRAAQPATGGLSKGDPALKTPPAKIGPGGQATGPAKPYVQLTHAQEWELVKRKAAEKNATLNEPPPPYSTGDTPGFTNPGTFVDMKSKPPPPPPRPVKAQPRKLQLPVFPLARTAPEPRPPPPLPPRVDARAPAMDGPELDSAPKAKPPPIPLRPGTKGLLSGGDRAELTKLLNEG